MGGVLDLCCAKFLHSFSPIDFYYGKGVVLVVPNFDMGWPLFLSIFEGRLMIKVTEGFWDWGRTRPFL